MREYASHFVLGGKDANELGVVEELIRAMPGLGFHSPESYRSDPPDCTCLDNRQHLVGVEVSELVSERYVSGKVHLQIERAMRQAPEKHRIASDPLTVPTSALPKNLRNSQFEVWTPVEFLSMVSERLAQKDRVGDSIDSAAFPGGYIVLLYTDEMWLTEQFVRSSLAHKELGPFTRIDRAFLLMSYVASQGSVEGYYPVLELSTSKIHG